MLVVKYVNLVYLNVDVVIVLLFFRDGLFVFCDNIVVFILVVFLFNECCSKFYW